MKLYKILSVIVGVLLLITSCKEKEPFENVAYIEAATTVNTEGILLKSKDTVIEKSVRTALAYSEGEDVKVSYSIDFSLVDRYNEASYTAYLPLPENFYELSESEALIPKGEVRSTEVVLKFKNLGDIPNNVTYVLPLSLVSANGVTIQNASKTIFYTLKKSAPITTVANIEANYLSIPSFATGGGAALNGLNQVTMEALIRVRDFDGGGKNISSVMGIEGTMLIRIGDAGFYANQIQIAGTAGNFPSQDPSKRLSKNEWYHVALTWDLTTKNITVYINGEIQSQGIQSFGTPTVNLGSSLFYLGRSYDDARDLRGDISECRVWSVIRTQQEIKDNMYELDPTSSGLQAYWKFNEGAGSKIKDYSVNGNDAVANAPLTWVAVELPAPKQ